MKMFDIIYLLIPIFIFVIQEDFIFCANNKFDDVFKGAQNVKCDNRSEQKVDSLITVLAPVGTDQRIPETESELRKYCNLATKSIPFVLGVLKHCTTPFAQTIAKFMFFPVRKQLDATCKPGKMSRVAREYISAGKCGNLAKRRLKQCNSAMIDALVGMKTVPVRNRIYMSCCHSNAYRLCLREATEDTVGCTRHTVDWAEKMVMKMVGGALSIACGEYFEESDKCIKLMTETPKPKYSKTNRRPKSIIRPMMTLMESFPDLDANKFT